MFDKFFSDNPFWKAMGQVFDIFIVNILWLLCCIPVFTIGPSTTAFFYVLLGITRGEEGYVSHDFFKSFKRNFKQGTALGLIFTAIGAFLIVDIIMCRQNTGKVFTFFLFFFACLFLLWSFITMYTFPLLSKFEKKSGELVLWAFILSIRNWWRTLLMLAAAAACIWLVRILPALGLILFGLAGSFQMMIMSSILKPYLPEYSDNDLAPLTFEDEELTDKES